MHNFFYFDLLFSFCSQIVSHTYIEENMNCLTFEKDIHFLELNIFSVIPDSRLIYKILFIFFSKKLSFETISYVETDPIYIGLKISVGEEIIEM